MQTRTASTEETFHPLELIPYFRRFPCSRTRNLIYTLIWSVMIGFFFLVLATAVSSRLPTARVAGIYFVMSIFIGFAIHALFEAGQMAGFERWVRARGMIVKTLYYTLLPTLGVIAGFQVTDWIFHIGFSRWIVSPSWIISIVGTSLVISSIISSVFYLREREARSIAELERERGNTERVQREALTANLRALQAQIEPHFLFNTLANVSSLIDRDPARARHMLDRFIRFLRASLAATRMESTTLGAERELIAAYLDVLSVRMESRLKYRIDIPAALDGFALAPMLLQPIVENAIRHGLEPKVEGGAIEIVARREADAVSIEVRDGGVGFGAVTPGGGVGLDNLRGRVRGLYGEGGSVSIADNTPSGTVVTIRIPA